MMFFDYCRVNCIILTFSIDDPMSLDDVENMYSFDISEAVELDQVPVVIAANNAHLRDDPDINNLIPIELIKMKEKELNVPIIEVSAKTSAGIEELFNTTIRKFLVLNNISKYKKKRK